MNILKHSAPDWCFYRDSDDPDSYYRALKAMDVHAVEMVASERWASARAAGLRVLNLGGHSIPHGFNRQEHHAELVAAVRKQIDVAVAEGIPQVIVFSGDRAGLDDAKGLDNCVRGLAQLAPHAEAAGVVLTFEMLNSIDHVDYQADRGAFGFEVVRRVGSPALKVIYDIFHMQRMGEALLDDLLGNLDAVAHIHVAATPLRTLPTNDGEIDYAGIVAAVTRAGYEGCWGHEFIPAGQPLDELAQAIARFEGYARDGNR